jgi:hypothetical protein
MMPVMMTDPAGGHVALYDENAGGGAYDDVNASRNAPLKIPASHLDKLYFHTALDNLEVAFDSTVAINHALVAGSSSGGLGFSGTAGGGGNENDLVVRYGRGATTHVLLNHNLGYIPDFMVVQGGNTLFGGMPVQTQADGRGRYCSAYATTTQILLHEWSSVSGSNLAAIALNYRIIVFLAQRAAAGSNLIDFDPSSGLTEMGKNRFKTDRRYLQVVPGGSPHSISLGRQMDLDNGAPRFSRPDNTQYDPVPAGQRSRLTANYGAGGGAGTYTGSWGSSMAYAGGYGGAAELLVQAPAPTGGGPKGFNVDVAAGRIEFYNGTGGTITTTDGTLVCLLPTVHGFSPTLSFADFNKDICYLWTGSVVSVGGGSFNQGESCACFITALAEETVSDTVLMAVPAGADFFIGVVRINRTNAPDDNWMGRGLGVLPVENGWMSIPGSFSALMESEINVSRAMHIFIDGGNLVLRREQSVGPPPGGYGSFPTLSDGANYNHRGSFTRVSTNGTPISLRASKSKGYSPGGTVLGGSSTDFQRTGGDPCATSDNTNYQSQYLVEIVGRFGRRS